ncbi:cytochrome P450 [Mycena vulgaris]|nr:cytochrome P450 [Mycena vulgaris]
MEALYTKTLIVSGLAVLVVSVSWLRSREKSTIPAIVGSEGLVSSYMAALHFMRHATDVIQQGYDRYPGGIFRTPTFFRWDYVANGSQRIKEIASAPESVLSFNEATADGLQADYTMGPQILNTPYHGPVLRGGLTRNLGRCFPQMRDEIVHAFEDVAFLDGNEWTPFRVLPKAMHLFARISNRVFVGLPLCREPEYLDLNIKYAVDIITRAQIIGLFPNFLKPSNDLITWLLEFAEGGERTAPALALRVLAINMALHTSSMTFTAALYNLTTYPEHILPMREEAERVVAEEGWTKASIASMHKIDSFLRESQRFTIGAVGMGRKVVAKEGFTFSDGTKIPYGAFIGVPATAVHHDPEIYDHPDIFDGFRFSRIREQGNDTKAANGIFNHHMTSTAPDHVVFGHGHHACPGRFFAAMALKAMLAHMLINYDLLAETEGVRPPNQYFGVFTLPNPQGRIMIRKRAWVNTGQDASVIGMNRVQVV